MDSYVPSGAQNGRRMSTGRGGAGNIRSHAEAHIELPEPGPDGQRRRSSVWSTASTTSRRSKIVETVKNMFSSKTEKEEKETPAQT